MNRFAWGAVSLVLVGCAARGATGEHPAPQVADPVAFERALEAYGAFRSGDWEGENTQPNQVMAIVTVEFQVGPTGEASQVRVVKAVDLVRRPDVPNWGHVAQDLVARTRFVPLVDEAQQTGQQSRMTLHFRSQPRRGAF